MASSKSGSGRIILIIVGVVLIAVGAVFGMAHHAVVEKANAAAADAGSASAAFSRFKNTDPQGFVIIWKLKYAKPNKHVPSVAVWHFKPWGAVDLEGAKK